MTNNSYIDGWAPREGYWTVAAARALAGPSPSASPPPQFATAGQYVGYCRRTRPDVFGDRSPARGGQLPNGEPAPDGRLIAAGWNRMSPTRWARVFEDFLEYWHGAASWPVGAECNPAPETVLAAWLAGTPAWVTRSLGERIRDRSQRVPRWRALPARRRRRLIYAAVAARRASARWRHAETMWYSRWVDHLDTGALAVLGRLCPEGQRAVLDAAREQGLLTRAADVPMRQIETGAWVPGEGSYIRARDLLPALEAAKPTLRALDSPAGPRVRLALALAFAPDGEVGRRAVQLVVVGGLSPDELPGYLSPAYPHVPLSVARRLCLGESPRQIAGGTLSAREAHEWASQGAPDVAEWLQCRLLGGMAEVPSLRDPEVVRWLAAVKHRGGWGQLTKERPLHLPGGETATWRALDRIDEIQVEDLVRGERTSVDAAFTSAAQRQGEAWAAQAREDHRVLAPLPGRWRLYKCMRHLNTPAALEREGREMNHCVGGYQSAVENGRSVILSITLRRRGVRSTVELSPSGRVIQHLGPQNEIPDPRLVRVLRRFCERRIGAERRSQ